jgi:hypothetical protein
MLLLNVLEKTLNPVILDFVVRLVSMELQLAT